jgi:hypothetical protein
MAEHLEFLRSVPGAAQSLGPTPPLDPLPAGVPAGRRRGSPDPVKVLRADLTKRLEHLGRERALVLDMLREDHRHYRELEAAHTALVDAMAELERHRLATAEGESADGN